MIRRLFIVASALSLILFIATCSMWWRSRHVGDEFYAENWKYGMGIGLRLNCLYLWEATAQVAIPAEYQFPWGIQHDRHPPRRGGIVWSMKHVTFLGAIYQFGTGLETDGYSYYHHELYLPWWAVTIALLLLPSTFAYLALRDQRRLNQGLCRKCGYDLRASPDRCPECGTKITAKTSSPCDPRCI